MKNSLRDYVLNTAASINLSGLTPFEAKLARDKQAAAMQSAQSRFTFPFFKTTKDAYAYLNRRGRRQGLKRQRHNPKGTPFGAWIAGVRIAGNDNQVLVLHATKGWRAVAA